MLETFPAFVALGETLIEIVWSCQLGALQSQLCHPRYQAATSREGLEIAHNIWRVLVEDCLA